VSGWAGSRGLRGLAVLSALIVLAPVAACAHRQDTPSLFLQRLYEPYVQGKFERNTPARTRELYSRELASLIERDRASAGGEVGRLDFDPICNCQDFDALTQLQVEVAREGDGAASARVTFRNGSDAQALVYSLKSESGRWRISDICSGEGQCLATLLMEP